jgi:hypothetical protein
MRSALRWRGVIADSQRDAARQDREEGVGPLVAKFGVAELSLGRNGWLGLRTYWRLDPRLAGQEKFRSLAGDIATARPGSGQNKSRPKAGGF